MSFEKVLIANRGEIAIRIIEACRELGLSTVAVYSEPDRFHPHVELADEAYCIGPKEPQESYLNFPAVMSAADIGNVDGIHPGYGFLSENSHFADVCEEHGLKFIGPSPSILEKAGDKVESKVAAKEAGVPVLPGSDRALEDKDDLTREAERLGYPLMLKAALGGGGRGMRVVDNEDELLSSFQASREEARISFDHGKIYLEKFLPDPKHIEVQIMADNHGEVISLGERDCSIQRRHQKLVEESPASYLSERTRASIQQAAVKIAEEFGYRSLGTVEFLVDDEENFYFIELNARVQVEHPVTEEVFGFNMIKDQLRLIQGEPLDPSKYRAPKGHALECRINAEDPVKDFRPSSGRVNIQQVPGGNGVRVDTWIRDGIEVHPSYDSLLAKLVIRGETRKDTITKAISSLRRFEISGVHTTRNLYLDLLRQPKFRSGEYTISFLDEFIGKWQSDQDRS